MAWVILGLSNFHILFSILFMCYLSISRNWSPWIDRQSENVPDSNVYEDTALSVSLLWFVRVHCCLDRMQLSQRWDSWTDMLAEWHLAHAVGWDNEGLTASPIDLPRDRAFETIDFSRIISLSEKSNWLRIYAVFNLHETSSELRQASIHQESLLTFTKCSIRFHYYD